MHTSFTDQTRKLTVVLDSEHCDHTLATQGDKGDTFHMKVLSQKTEESVGAGFIFIWPGNAVTICLFDHVQMFQSRYIQDFIQTFIRHCNFFDNIERYRERVLSYQLISTKTA